jgi:hypothetical protein
MTAHPGAGDLLIAAAVASFDMISGIKVIHRWLPRDDDISGNLVDVFKITLSNVHRQSEQAYAEAAVSTVEIQSLAWFVVNSIFILARKPRSIYYSVGLVFDTRAIPETPHFAEILIYWCRVLSRASKHCLIANVQLNSLSPLIENIIGELAIVAQNSIPRAPAFEIIPADNRLNFLLLTAHFQSQMTTVIEAGATKGSPALALKIGCFLAQFLLPFQRQLSSLALLPRPSRHLYLQLVEKQVRDRDEMILAFGKPVTWVMLTDRDDSPVIIWRCSGQEDQKLQDDYIEASVIGKLTGDDTSARIEELKRRTRKDPVVSPAPWATGTVTLINWVPKNARAAICEQQLGAMLRCAISIVAIVREKQVGSAGATVDQYEKEIQRALKLTGADWEMAFGVAQLYDRGIGGALDAGSKKGLARSLSSY